MGYKYVVICIFSLSLGVCVPVFVHDGSRFVIYYFSGFWNILSTSCFMSAGWVLLFGPDVWYHLLITWSDHHTTRTEHSLQSSTALFIKLMRISRQLFDDAGRVLMFCPAKSTKIMLNSLCLTSCQQLRISGSFRREFWFTGVTFSKWTCYTVPRVCIIISII